MEGYGNAIQVCVEFLDCTGNDSGKSSEIWDAMEVEHPTHYRNFIKSGKNDGIVWQIGGRVPGTAEKQYSKAGVIYA